MLIHSFVQPDFLALRLKEVQLGLRKPFDYFSQSKFIAQSVKFPQFELKRARVTKASNLPYTSFEW